jgi:hypothetical protein
MNDALERFAVSLSHARGVFGLDLVADLERVILTGKGKLNSIPEASPTPVVPSGAAFIPEAGNGGDLEFSFSEETPAFDEQPDNLTASVDQPATDVSQTAAASRSPKVKKPKRKKIMGLTVQQLAIVVALLLCWLCGLLAFAGYYFYSIGWIQFA